MEEQKSISRSRQYTPHERCCCCYSKKNLSSDEKYDLMLTRIDCGLYRLIGLVLLCTSLVSLVIIFRYFVQRYRQRHIVKKCLSPILIGMLGSSVMIMISAIPFVLIQCFTCQPYKSHFLLCKMQGFICFANGIFNMYMLALLSILRYLSVLHTSSALNCLLEHRHGSSVLFCALFAASWALPPLFGAGNDYVSEGIGLHCSLNWRSSTLRSRHYLNFTILFIYLVPFLLLVYSNLRVYFALRRLLQSRENLFSPISTTQIKCPTTNTTSSSYLTNSLNPQTKIRQRPSIEHLRQKTNRLQRLHVDQRYARMTTMMTTQYLIAWTPYACVALLSIDGRIEFMDHKPVLSAVCAVLAKLSFILNPLIFIYTNQIEQPPTTSSSTKLNEAFQLRRRRL